MRRYLGITCLSIVAAMAIAGCTTGPRADISPSTVAGSTPQIPRPTVVPEKISPTTPSASGPDGSMPVTAISSSTPAPGFGQKQINLSCDESAGDLPSGDPADVITLGAATVTGLRGQQDPTLATEVGLVAPPGGKWYFRKAPIYVKAGAGPVTLTISGTADEFLAWVPAPVWTSGSKTDLQPWATKSVTFEGCADHGAMYLGGLLAADPSRDFELVSSGGISSSAARISLEAGGQIMLKQLVTDSCKQARPITSKFPGPTDVAIGPLSYAGLQSFGGSPVQETNWNGGYFYKSGAQLEPGVSATITIGDSAAGYAAIVTEAGPSTGSRSVTYQSCPRSDTGATGSWWVGGLVLFGRNKACVPLTVTVPGEQATHHIVVSLGAGSCGGT